MHYHVFNGVNEALVELSVLKVVLWVVYTVHHPTGTADGHAKLLLACVLMWENR